MELLNAKLFNCQQKVNIVNPMVIYIYTFIS